MTTTPSIPIAALLLAACASSGDDGATPGRDADSPPIRGVDAVESLRALNAERAQREERARFGPIAQEVLDSRELRCIGGLRQVQLLEVDDGPEPRARFVTAYQCRTASTSREPGAEGPRTNETSLIALYERPIRADEELIAFQNGMQVVEDGWSDAGLMGSDTGHAVAFAGDADGDGAPELLVASPTIVLSPRVDLVSSSSDGAALGCALDDFSGLDFGSSVAVDPTGDYALIGGGYTTRPEDYRKPSAARLIRIRNESGEYLVTLATWTLAAGDLVIERGVPEQPGGHE